MKHTLIILGGNSPKNAVWASQLATSFSRHANVHLHTYKHWEVPGAEIDFASELAHLHSYLESIEGDYSIVAKSAGAILALQGIGAGKLVPKTLVCIGLPLTYAEHRHIPLQEIVASNMLPTLYVQAAQDPTGSAQDVAALTAHHGSFVSVEGDSHDYADIADLVARAMEFINAH